MEDIKARAARAVYGDYAQNNPLSTTVGHDAELDGKIELPRLNVPCTKHWFCDGLPCVDLAPTWVFHMVAL